MMMSVNASTPRPRTGWKITLIVLALILLPVGLGFFVIPLLQGMPFDSPAELSPENVQSLRVHVLNRKELDGGEDLGPYYASAEDYERLLAPLKAAAAVGSYPDARGPFLGEYRVVLTSGRKGTIRLYWSRPSSGGPGDAPPVARLRFQIGEHLYEGPAAADVIRAVEECAARGK
jgi:hypothetical protein